MGIEPTYIAWKAIVLPLNYARMVGRRGFEPLKHKCSRFQVPSGYPEAWTISLP